MDSETAAAIVRDVSIGIAVADSKVTYGPEEKAFRSKVESEWTAWLKTHPGARLEVPADIDGLPD
jgi:hypothetical protein